MAEGARLESVYTERYRGFESLPHRHLKPLLYQGRFFYVNGLMRYPFHPFEPNPAFKKLFPINHLTNPLQISNIRTR